MLVYLDDYRKTRSSGATNGARETRLKNGTYGDDDINANWSPAVLYALLTPPQAALSPDLPEDMAAIDIESFMNRIYALASQV